MLTLFVNMIEYSIIFPSNWQHIELCNYLSPAGLPLFNPSSSWFSPSVKGSQDTEAKITATAAEDVQTSLLVIPSKKLVLPSGYLTVRHEKIHPFLSSVNHLFLWAIYTMANCECHNQMLFQVIIQVKKSSDGSGLTPTANKG